MSAHDWQLPVHDVAQQVDWLQFPCTHSAPVVQEAPSDFLPQTMVIGSHVLGLTQSALDVHLARHAPVPHTNGVQGDCVPGWQTPEPLHSGADVKIEPEHIVEPHVVPAA